MSTKMKRRNNPDTLVPPNVGSRIYAPGNDAQTACAFWVQSLPTEFVLHHDLELADHTEEVQAPSHSQQQLSAGVNTRSNRHLRHKAINAIEESVLSPKPMVFCSASQQVHTTHTEKRVRFDVIDGLSGNSMLIPESLFATPQQGQRSHPWDDAEFRDKVVSQTRLPSSNDWARCDRGSSPIGFPDVDEEPRTRIQRPNVHLVNRSTSPIRSPSRLKAVRIGPEALTEWKPTTQNHQSDVNSNGKHINFFFNM